MKHRDIIFGLVVLGVIAILAVLSAIGKKPAPIQPIVEHAGITSKTPRSSCMECHDPDPAKHAMKPLTRDHPQKWRDAKMSCTICHRVPA